MQLCSAVVVVLAQLAPQCFLATVHQTCTGWGEEWPLLTTTSCPVPTSPMRRPCRRTCAAVHDCHAKQAPSAASGRYTEADWNGVSTVEEEPYWVSKVGGPGEGEGWVGGGGGMGLGRKKDGVGMGWMKVLNQSRKETVALQGESGGRGRVGLGRGEDECGRGKVGVGEDEGWGRMGWGRTKDGEGWVGARGRIAVGDRWLWGRGSEGVRRERRCTAVVWTRQGKSSVGNPLHLAQTNTLSPCAF